MRAEYGFWNEQKISYIDMKTIPGVITTDADIIKIIDGVQKNFAPWHVGCVSCDTEVDPRNLQWVRILGSAKGFPSLPSTVAEVTTVGSWKQPINEFTTQPVSLFANRFPPNMHSIAGFILVITHALGHAAGLGHNPNPQSFMYAQLTPSVKHWDDMDMAILNVSLPVRTPENP